MRYALSNLQSLSNKVRSSASCCFIAEDFLYMADAESFRPRWTDQLHKEQMSKLAMDRPDYMERYEQDERFTHMIRCRCVEDSSSAGLGADKRDTSPLLHQWSVQGG